MDRRTEAEMLCKELIKKHNPAVTFGFNRRKAAAGVTRWRGGGVRIELSKHFVNSPSVSMEEIRETVLHELAHSLTGTPKHDKRWRQCALELGCRAERTCEQFAEGPYCVCCRRCGTRTFIYRKPKHYRGRCRGCGASVYVEESSPQG